MPASTDWLMLLLRLLLLLLPPPKMLPSKPMLALLVLPLQLH